MWIPVRHYYNEAKCSMLQNVEICIQSHVCHCQSVLMILSRRSCVWISRAYQEVVHCTAEWSLNRGWEKRIEQASKGKCQKQRIATLKSLTVILGWNYFFLWRVDNLNRGMILQNSLKIGTQYMEVLLFNKVIQQTEKKTAPYLKNTVFENNETQKLP